MFFSLFFSVFIPVVLGYLSLSLILGKEDVRLGLPLSLALSFSIGMALVAQGILILGWLNVPLTFFRIFFVFLSLILFLSGIVARRKAFLNIRPVSDPMEGLSSNDIFSPLWSGIIEIVFFVYLAWIIFEVFWLALSKPVFTWDSLATSIYVAKIVYYQKSLALHPFFPHASFPLQIPLSVFWVNTFLGEWNDQIFKILFPLIFLSILTLNYYFIKIFVNKLWAKIGILFLISSNLLVYHASVPYRDLWLQLYICSSLFFLFLWIRERKNAYLVLSSLFLGFMTFVKLEGLGYVPIIFTLFIFALVSLKDKLRSMAANVFSFVFPALTYSSIYFFYKAQKGIAVNEKATFDFGSLNWARFFMVLKRFVQEMFLTPNWHIVYFVLFLSLLINYQVLKKNLYAKVMALGLVLFLALHFFIAICTQESQSILSLNTLSRVLLHFYPVAIWLIIFLNTPVKEPVSTR